MKFDFDYYQNLLEYRCETFDDEAQAEFLEFLDWELRLYGFTVRYDDYGNLIADRKYADNQLMPMIIAHVDINQHDMRIPKFHNIDGYIIGMRNGVQVGCGHDDRAGVYFALLYAQHTNMPCRIVFTKDEECGGVGASRLGSDVFENITMAVQLDRRGKSDISDATNGVEVVSSKFKSKAGRILKEFGYKWTRTIFTDVGVLKSTHNVGFCCMNISCGYYNEHTDSECLSVSEFENAVLFASTLLIKLGYNEVHKHVAPKMYKSPAPVFKNNTYSNRGYDGYGFGRSSWERYWDTIEAEKSKKFDDEFVDDYWESSRL
jgi:putative aminopeptidase FrvX